MANLILYGELTRKADLYRWGAHQDTKEIELKGWRAEQLSYGYNYMDSIYPEGGATVKAVLVAANEWQLSNIKRRLGDGLLYRFDLIQLHDGQRAYIPIFMGGKYQHRRHLCTVTR